MKRSGVLVSVVVGVGTLIVGSAAPAARQPQAVRSAQARTLIASVNVTATEFEFVLSKKTEKRGLVIFRIKNAGKLGHDFQINGRKTRVIPPGKSDTLRVTFLRKGHYTYKCTVPRHGRRNDRCLHHHLKARVRVSRRERLSRIIRPALRR